MKIRFYKIAAIVSALCIAHGAIAQSLQSSIQDIVNDPALSEAVVGICVRSGDGRTLAEIDADNMILPASNMKLISTGAALHTLGPEHQFETKIGHDGQILEGILKGNLYIIGGGDPTTCSKDSIATPQAELFCRWEHIIREAGIQRIEGYVIGDGRYFDGMPEHPSWQLESKETLKKLMQ